MKGLIVRNFNWWLDQKMFDRDGILTIGYCYPQMYMAERYNAPGSPYWGMKSFILLALPDSHPFWSAEAEPMPALDVLKPMPHANMLVARTKGRVTAYAAGVNEGHGHGQFPEKYAKFAYDTRFGFCASRSREVIYQAAPDSMLAFVIDDNVFVRKVSLSHEIRADRVVSKWSPFPGITVTTTVLPTADGHIRRHEIESAYPCEAYDCGFAVPNFAPGYVESTAGGAATARNAAVSCTVSGSGEGTVIKCDPQRQPVQHQRLYPCRPVRHPRGAHRDRDRDQSPGVRATPDILSGEIYTKAIFAQSVRASGRSFCCFFGPLRPCGPPPPHAWEASVPASVLAKFVVRQS